MIELVISHTTFAFSRFDYDPHRIPRNTTAPQPPSDSKDHKLPSKSQKVLQHNNMDPKSRKPNPAAKPVDVHVDVSTSKSAFFNDRQKRIENSMHRILKAASNIRQAVALFNEIDADGSGQLDALEFSKLLENMGMAVTDDRVNEIIEQYDADMSGSVGIDEFITYCRNEARSATAKLRDLLEDPILCKGKASTQQKKALERYVPPYHGRLYLSVEDTFKVKPIHRILSSIDREGIQQLAEQAGDMTTSVSHGIDMFQLRLHDALHLADSMQDSSKIALLLKILPTLSKPSDARQLTKKILKGNRMELAKLKKALGDLHRVFFGTPDGHYCLDMSDPRSQQCTPQKNKMSIFFFYQL